jgi:hypothetical protein
VTTTETFDNAADFLAALKGTKRKAAKDARPGLPRAASGEGDRINQLGRIAAYGYSPRFDVGVGFSFWNVYTKTRTTVCAEYAQACAVAEQELSK